MNYIKIPLVFLALIITVKISAQVPALGGGLAFSSGIDVNGLSTGNPGIYGKAYLKFGKQMKIVPSISAFRPGKRTDLGLGTTLKNYMFMGDLDLHYSVFYNKPLRVILFTGINTTAVISKWDNLVGVAENKNEISPGLNLGGAIYMFVNNSFDAYVSGKYIAQKSGQAVINLGIIFYPEGLRRRGGW